MFKGNTYFPLTRFLKEGSCLHSWPPALKAQALHTSVASNIPASHVLGYCKVQMKVQQERIVIFFFALYLATYFKLGSSTATPNISHSLHLSTLLLTPNFTCIKSTSLLFLFSRRDQFIFFVFIFPEKNLFTPSLLSTLFSKSVLYEFSFPCYLFFHK